jgi:hypothetical protein
MNKVKKLKQRLKFLNKIHLRGNKAIFVLSESGRIIVCPFTYNDIKPKYETEEIHTLSA